MFDWVLNTSLHPPAQEHFTNFYGRKIPEEKKLSEFRKNFLQMFGETSRKKPSLLAQKILI